MNDYISTINSTPNSVMTIIATMYGTLLAISIVVYIISVIAKWKQFTKAGEAGWKALIPIYNTYMEFKLYYNTNMFWIVLITSIVYFVSIKLVPTIGAIVGIFYLIISFIAAIKLIARKARSFGHGVGFAIGLFVFGVIFECILAFDKSVYTKLEN